LTVTRPNEQFSLPALADLETELPALIDGVAAKGRFSDPRVTTVTWKAKPRSQEKA
jgi:hypothetical protein